MKLTLNNQLMIEPPVTIITDEHVAPRDERYKIWEINRCFKCPILGMCLTLSEQKQLLKKMGALKKHLSPYELHEILVTAMDTENRVSHRIDNMLERKYLKKAQSLLVLETEDYLAQLKERLEAGDAGVILWTTAVSPSLSPDCRRKVFGEIHMAMHWNGEQLMRLKKKLARQRHEAGILEKRCKQAMRLRQKLKKEVCSHKRAQQELRKSLGNYEKENCQLQATIEKLESNRDSALERENRALAQTCDELRKQLVALKNEKASIEEENDRLLSEQAVQADMVCRFKEETKAIVEQMVSLKNCDATCPSFDLCKKRILIVGGVTRMESLYRDLIEGSNGVFEYHDGYIKKGVKELESRMKRADMVLCPVNCNSHAACSMVKNLGKKHNKTVHILSNTSLSTVSQVLWGNNEENTCMLN